VRGVGQKGSAQACVPMKQIRGKREAVGKSVERFGTGTPSKQSGVTEPGKRKEGLQASRETLEPKKDLAPRGNAGTADEPYQKESVVL